MLQMFFSSTSMSISLPFNSRTMPKSFLTGTVAAPPFFTFASTEQATVTSKSVAVNSSFSPSTLIRTFDRIGRVVRALTTFCTACRPLRICSFAMVRFMRYLIVSSFVKGFLILCTVNKINNLFCQGKHGENQEKKKIKDFKAGVKQPFPVLLHSFHNSLTRKA